MKAQALMITAADDGVTVDSPVWVPWGARRWVAPLGTSVPAGTWQIERITVDPNVRVAFTEQTTSDRANYLLGYLREYVDTIVRGQRAGGSFRPGAAYGRDDIVHAFAELDSLLSAGGLMPDPWDRSMQRAQGIPLKVRMSEQPEENR